MGPEQQSHASPATSSTSSSSARRPRRRSRAASSNVHLQRHDARLHSTCLRCQRRPERASARRPRATSSSRPRAPASADPESCLWDLVGSITAQHVERAPKPAELFSRGPHDATATFDIGNPNLKIEVANSIEAGLRRATGPFRFELTGYYTKFNGFIFRRLTGNTCSEGRLRRSGPGDGVEAGGLFAARRDLPRRRVPEPVRRRAAVDRRVGHREPVRRRARDLHRRHQRAAHSAGARRRRRVLPRRQLARPRQPAACLPAERHRAHRRDADPGLQQLLQGRDQLHAGSPHGCTPTACARSWSASPATTCSTTTSATASPTTRTRSLLPAVGVRFIRRR